MGRAVGLLFLGLGVAVTAVTVAAKTGHLPGVGVEWPALVVAAVLAVIGLANLRRERPSPEGPAERGPIRESGLTEADVAEDAVVQAAMREMAARQARRADESRGH